MLRKKRLCEDLSVPPPNSSAKSIQESRKHNFDTSLVLINATDTTGKRNPSLKTPKRNEILIAAARKMRNYKGTNKQLRVIQGNAMDGKIIPNCRKPLSTIQGIEKNSFNSRKLTSTIRRDVTEENLLKGEHCRVPYKGIGQTYGKIAISQPKTLCHGKKGRSKCYKNGTIGIANFKEVSTDAMTSVSDLTMLSPKYSFQRRESRLHKKALSNDSVSNDRTSKRRRLQNHRENDDAPFNSDAAFSSLYHDIPYETMKDYKRADGFLSMKISSSSHYSSDMDSDLSTVEDFSITSQSDDTSQITYLSENSSHKRFASDNTPVSSSNSTLDTSHESCSTYTSSAFEVKTYMPPRENKNLTRKEKIVSSATDKVLKFVDAVATRVCDCLAPEVDSPRPKSLGMSKCTFYRDHENSYRRRAESLQLYR